MRGLDKIAKSYGESSEPLLEWHSIYTTSAEWQTVLEWRNDPDKKTFIFWMQVVMDGNPAASGCWIRISSNGKKLVRGFNSYDGFLFCDFYGKLVFKGKLSKPAILIECHSNGVDDLYVDAFFNGVVVPWTPPK